LDAFAFVDDQPFERAEVAHQVPEVLCIPVEDAGHLPDFAPFQPRFVTEDSKLRRLMYVDDQRRSVAERGFSGTNEEFLASLDMRLTIAPARESDLQRAEELTIRTHQLNSTGRFFSYEQLNELRHDDRFRVLVVDLKDRFGPYGRVGLAVIECQQTIWTVKLILMSCRVVSRGVGAVVLSYLKRAAEDAGVRLRAEFVPTPRNRMMYVTLKFNGFREIEKNRGLTLLENDLPECPPLPSYMTVRIYDE
jgi:FkbH-like protein